MCRTLPTPSVASVCAKARLTERSSVSFLIGMGSARREPVRSRVGGVATVLGAPADGSVGQLDLGVVGGGPRPRAQPLPDVIHVPDWLDGDAQRGLVADFRRWALPPA